jgi:glucosamine kinase
VNYYLGIDGGGSKTTCAVGDESAVLATVTTGPSNITRVGETRAREALRSAIHEACATAKIDPRLVRHACIGVAGAGREAVASTVRNIVAELIPGEIEVVGDMQIALAAAFGAGPGVIVIAGTGSIAYARNARGETARAGGWGFAVSDEGSAYWIGRTAVSALLREIDEAKAGAKRGEDHQAIAEALPLFREMKAAWDLHSLDEFVRVANSNPDFAKLLSAILAAANGGDLISQRVLAQAGRELAQLAAIVVRQLFAENSDTVALAMAGGVFRHSARVREMFRSEVGAIDRQLEVKPEIVDPVKGALQMARTPDRDAKA